MIDIKREIFAKYSVSNVTPNFLSQKMIYIAKREVIVVNSKIH
jgi:hypothetical protein